VKRDWLAAGLAVVGFFDGLGAGQFGLNMAHDRAADVIELLKWPVIANMESDAAVVKTQTLGRHIAQLVRAQELRV